MIVNRVITLSLIFFYLGFLFSFIIFLYFNDDSLALHDRTDRKLLQQKLRNNLLAVTKRHVDVLILIFSLPHSLDVRQAVRETWISDLTQDTAYMFVISIEHDFLSLEDEIYRYNDILLLNEKSLFLSSQQLLLSFKWAVTNVSFKYLLKCNDVSFISVRKLLNEIKNFPAEGFLWGYFIGNQNVTRDGLKAEPHWNLCTTYLPYPAGGGYLLSRDLVGHIKHFAPLLKHMDNEDIAIGAWLSPLKHIQHYHEIKFNTDVISRGCLNQYLISHPETVDSMKNKYHNLHEKGHICENEEEIIKSYNYNWTAPVTSCCLT